MFGDKVKLKNYFKVLNQGYLRSERRSTNNTFVKKNSPYVMIEILRFCKDKIFKQK